MQERRGTVQLIMSVFNYECNHKFIRLLTNFSSECVTGLTPILCVLGERTIGVLVRLHN